MITRPDQGERLGKYELVTVLAKSPLGPTWLARSIEPSDTTPVVVAVRRLTLGSTLAKADKDLLAQAAVWALSETSEGALNSLDIVVTGQELDLVREHAIGQPLRTLLRRCSLNAQTVPCPVVLRLALDVLETLNAIASKGHRLASGVAVHCGLLGPDFLWVTSDGRTLLTECGVSSALRATAAFGGSADLVAYAAPEQLSGTLDDQRSDIFVLGVMLWELLSGGRRLFQGSDPSEVAAAVRSAPIGAPVASGSTPNEAETSALAIVMRALDRDSNQRFQSPAQMRQAIADLAPSAVASREEVAGLIAVLSGGELAMQDEAIRRALGHASSQKPGETAETRKHVSAAPPSTQPRLSSENGAPPLSSPPPKPAASPVSSPPPGPAASPISSPPPKPAASSVSSPASQPPASLSESLDGPTSSVPESIPPRTDEVDSAWGEEPEPAAKTPAATAANPVVSGAPQPAQAPAAAALSTAPTDPPAPRPGGSQSASQHPAQQPGAARVITLASAGRSSPSYGAVSIVEPSARAVLAEPGRGPRWQMAATAVFLALAGVFTIIALTRKPVAREPKAVAAAAEVARAPAPTVDVPSASAKPSEPVRAEVPTARPRTEEAGGGEDAGTFAAALSERLSISTSSARNESKKKGKGDGAAKTASSADDTDPHDVLRRLESQRRDKKDKRGP